MIKYDKVPRKQVKISGKDVILHKGAKYTFSKRSKSRSVSFAYDVYVCEKYPECKASLIVLVSSENETYDLSKKDKIQTYISSEPHSHIVVEEIIDGKLKMSEEESDDSNDETLGDEISETARRRMKLTTNLKIDYIFPNSGRTDGNRFTFLFFSVSGGYYEDIRSNLLSEEKVIDVHFGSLGKEKKKAHDVKVYPGSKCPKAAIDDMKKSDRRNTKMLNLISSLNDKSQFFCTLMTPKFGRSCDVDVTLSYLTSKQTLVCGYRYLVDGSGGFNIIPPKANQFEDFEDFPIDLDESEVFGPPEDTNNHSGREIRSICSSCDTKAGISWDWMKETLTHKCSTGGSRPIAYNKKSTNMWKNLKFRHMKKNGVKCGYLPYNCLKEGITCPGCLKEVSVRNVVLRRRFIAVFGN